MYDAVSQAKSERAEIRRQVMGGFVGVIPEVKVRFFYRFAMFLVAICMILLPLVYLGVVGLAGFAIFYHMSVNAYMLEGGLTLIIIAYCGPLLIGGIILIFMIKPLFARAAKKQEPYRLDPADEPLLFEFVYRICKAVNAPRPAEIHADCLVNASAGFRRGIWSIFGKDLVLTIGLPLVAGINLRQFAGILAHEFGHFSQGAGMRMNYIIRSINIWFSRVVYERDAWDEGLKSWSQEGTWHTIIIFWTARIIIWLTRRVLWVLMMLGHFLSCVMSRQMEHDADRYEAKLAGSDVFESSMQRLPLIAVANERTISDLGWSWEERRLVDNLPVLTMANLGKMPEEVKNEIFKSQAEAKPGWADTHPTDQSRIQNTRDLAAPGVFNVDLEAKVVFSDFDRLSKEVSFAYFKEVLEGQVKAEHLLPAEEYMQRQAKEEEGASALKRVFQDQISALRPIVFPEAPPAAPADPDQAISRLAQLRESFMGGVKFYAEKYKQYDQADTRTLELSVAEGLVHLGLSIDAKTFNMFDTEPTTFAAERSKTKTLKEKVLPEMEPFEAHIKERLLLALSLLGVPQTSARISDAAELKAEVDSLWPAILVSEKMLPNVFKMRTHQGVLGTLTESIEKMQDSEVFVDAIKTQVEFVTQQLKAFYDKLGPAAYPFAEPNDSCTLRDYIIRQMPAGVDLGEDLQIALEAGHGVEYKMYALYFRMLGCLAVAVERVEQAVGLEPLAEPPEEEKE
jgi:Zn-dependent protease with chaperone function